MPSNNFPQFFRTEFRTENLRTIRLFPFPFPLIGGRKGKNRTRKASVLVTQLTTKNETPEPTPRMNKSEIESTVRVGLHGVDAITAKSEIQILMADPGYQEKRMLFGAEGERAREIWQQLHRLAYPSNS